MIPTRRMLLTGVAACLLTPAAAHANFLERLFSGKSAPEEKFDTVVKRGQVAFIQVRKADRRLDLIGKDREILKTFRIQLGEVPVGPKRFHLDGKTPEGAYRIDRRNAQSQFYKSLGVNYPSASDRRFAWSHGRSPGGDIMIHGQHRKAKGTVTSDWTRGCIAVSNEDMDELWTLIPIGCPINIHA